MNSVRRLLTLGFLVFLIGTINIEAEAKDKWVKVQTENFTLIGNANEKKVRQVATKLEQFRHVFSQLFPSMSHKSPIPTSVVVFKSKGSFKPYKSIKWAAGYFQAGSDINYIALHTGGDVRHLFTTIFHEYIHFLVNNNIGKSRMPPWFSEGIAEYYDQFKIEKDQIVKLGLPNDSHLISLQRSKLIPFDTFFNIDHYSLHQQGSHSANIFYAQSWALTHYLMKGNGGARRDQFSVFLSKIVAGEDPKSSFSEVFKTDYKTMEKELRRYVRKRRYGITTATFKRKLLFDEKMQSTPLTESESKAHLGDLLFHIRKYDKAAAVLKESIALDPSQSFANATLGVLLMRQKKYSEARGYLEKAINSGKPDYRTYYQYAQVLSREGSKGGAMDAFGGESAGLIRKMVKKSIALNPSFPGSYDLLARVSLMTGDNLDEGIASLRKALTFSPGNQWYMLNLANLYLRKREIDKAIPIVASVSKTADEPQLRSYASRLLKDLRRYQSQATEAKEKGYSVIEDSNEAPSLTRRRDGKRYSELTPEEREKARLDSEIRAINRSLRKPKADEKRLLGYLSKVTCPRGTVSYIVKTNGGEMKFVSKDFQSLDLAVYNVDIGDFQVGCGTIKKELFAVITYRPETEKKSKNMGAVTAIEFVQANFKLIEEK